LRAVRIAAACSTRTSAALSGYFDVDLDVEVAGGVSMRTTFRSMARLRRCATEIGHRH
jgi:hypothetical protein